MPGSKGVPTPVPEPLWVEGEHIPTGRLTEVFRSPPGVPSRPPRSALIIGSRGAGKTTFLRHLARVHRGVAISLSLGLEMASISQELPKGFLAVDSDPEEEQGIVGKAVALAAAGMAQRALIAGVSVEPAALMAAVPEGIIDRRPRSLNPSSVQTIRTAVDQAELDRFEALAKGRVLQQFASSLGQACDAQGLGPLLILLDRGDNVVPTCLAAVFQLLDQSDAYTAVAAMRPGPSPPPQLVDTPASAAAGDHYDVFTLGARPRSQPWLEFVEESLRAQRQLADGLDLMPRELVAGVLALSRDSVRVAIDVLGRVLSAPNSQSDESAALDGMHDIAENLQLSAKKLLRQFHPDVAGLLRELRADLQTRGAAAGTPCLLSVQSPRQASLLETTTDVDRMIAVGLRCGAFCLPDGVPWAPGDRPLEVEIHPLMLWRREDGIPGELGEVVELRKTSGDLLGGRRTKASTSIFCAYRMQRPTSAKFVSDLSREVRRHPALSSGNVAVTNGMTDPGEKWASTIRNRISKAKAVVADVTDMRPDVVFEAGFAYGCSTPVIPVVETSEARDAVPRWLSDLQTAIFTEKAGMNGIINRLVTILNDPRAARRGPPKPAPGKVVWLRTLSWNLHALEQVRSICGHEGMVLEIYPSPEDPELQASSCVGVEHVPVEELIEKAARAHLLIVSVDGTRGDDLMHYIAGAVAAKPKTATDGAARRVLVVHKAETPPNGLVADSLARVTEVVRPVADSHVHGDVTKFAASYNRWADGV